MRCHCLPSVNKLCCIISQRAQTAIENELGRFPYTETGGLLLGYYKPEKGIFVLEATDSGYQDVIHEVGCFQYDTAYEEHLCGILSSLYKPPLQLVGVWHKHNSVHSDVGLPFSHADEDMHNQLMKNGCPCVSILFEKNNISDLEVRYKTSVFWLSADGQHQEITEITTWNKISCENFLTR